MRGNIEKDFGVIKEEDFWIKKVKTFLIACLLHDVGHAPFSHTLEYCYFCKEDHLKDRLLTHTFSKEFKEDFKNQKSIQPHEIMSVLIGIEEFGSRIENYEEFFARAILGLPHDNPDFDPVNPYYDLAIENCFIKLLNSGGIDVDKLDYLARDIHMTGYEGIKVDTKRLLSGVCLALYKDKLEFAYNKSALSVIENVILATDSEKKWIQNHPIILYDSFLIIKCINKIGLSEDIFCKEALGKKGVTIYLKDTEKKGISTNYLNIKLLSDPEIIFLIKRIDEENYEYAKEYLNRDQRKHAIWKSEAEYNLVIKELGLSHSDNFLKFFKGLELKNIFEQSLDFTHDTFNLRCYNEYKNALQEYENELSNDDENLKTKKKNFDKYISPYNFFKKLADEYGIEFDFSIIKKASYKSKVKIINNTLVNFRNFKNPQKFKSAMNSYEKNDVNLDEDMKDVYFIYYKSPKWNLGKRIGPKDFIDFFMKYKFDD